MLAVLHEVEALALERCAGKLEFLEQPQVLSPEEEYTCYHHGADKGCNDTHARGNGKAFNRTTCNPEKDDGGDKGGDVGVPDGGECLLVCLAQAHQEGTACSTLFAHAFVDEHVGVHCHTHGQHDTGDTRQREHKAEEAHEAQQGDSVEGKAHHSHHAGAAVVPEAEEEHTHQTHGTGDAALLQGALTQLGGYILTAFHLQVAGERVGQSLGNVFRFALAVQAADVEFLVEYGLHHGGALNLVVEHHGQTVAANLHGARQAAHAVSTRTVEYHVYIALAYIVGMGLCHFLTGDVHVLLHGSVGLLQHHVFHHGAAVLVHHGQAGFLVNVRIGQNHVVVQTELAGNAGQGGLAGLCVAGGHFCLVGLQFGFIGGNGFLGV